jgi:tryptophan-rich sensory protein
MSDTKKRYKKLKKPGWAPPDWLFGVVWSVLYPIIIAVNVYVLVLLRRGTIDHKLASIFWLNLAFNFAFTPIQFWLKNNWLAFVDIVLVLATIVWAIIAIWPHSAAAGLAFLPYLIWVGIATALQSYIAFKN